MSFSTNAIDFDNLSCTYANVQSIFNKKREIELYISENNIDILLFTETFICNHHDPSEYFLQDFQCFPFFKNRGGSCIYVRNRVSCYQVFPPNTCNDSVWIVIKTQDSRKRLYGCVYLSPNTTNVNRELLLENINWAKCNFTESIIVGDFNLPDINWSTHTASSQYSKMFLDQINDCGYEQVVSNPTRYRNNQNASLLDLILISEPDVINELAIEQPFGKSDHCKLNFKVKNRVQKIMEIPHKLNFKRLDEEKFISEMSKIDTTVLTNDDLESSYNYFLNKVNAAILFSVPKYKKKERIHPPWSNRKIGKLSKIKRKKWDRYKFSKSQTDYIHYQDALKNFLDEKDKAVLDFEKNIRANKKTNPKKYYNYVSRKSKYSNKKIVLKFHDEVETNDRKCADIMNNYFASVFTAGTSNLDVDLSRIPSFPVITELIITKDMIDKTISELQVNKSSGPDGIPAFLIKKFQEIFSPLLKIIFTRSFNEGIVPMAMKMATIIPLHKGGDRTDPGNYRPVSLTSIIAKMMEKNFY